MKKVIGKLIEKRNLECREMKSSFEAVVEGRVSDVDSAAFLVAMESKGASVDEIYQAAKVLRAKCKSEIFCGIDGVDTCGTGGDGKNLINISTIASIVASSCGAKVIKHGNRSVSSLCGSADLLEHLGVEISMDSKRARRCALESGMTFLYAPLYHQAMKNVSKIRSTLGIRTIFNIIGPLCNPANVSFQLMGVSEERLTDIMAKVLKKLGVKRAMVVHGMDGSDEISLCALTKVSELFEDGTISSYHIDPRDYGFSFCRHEELTGGNPDENADIARRILENEDSKRRDVVILNAAAILYVSGVCPDMSKGVSAAKEALESGAALEKLDDFVRMSREE